MEAIVGAESVAYVRGHLLTPDTQSLITNLLRRFTAFTTKTLFQRIRLVHALLRPLFPGAAIKVMK